MHPCLNSYTPMFSRKTPTWAALHVKIRTNWARISRKRGRILILVGCLLVYLIWSRHTPPLDPILFPINGPADASFLELQAEVAKGTARLHPVRDGELLVDPHIPVHPIEQAIVQAQIEWDKKLARQSRTLRQATKEYRVRYGRHPPPGFDKWWEWVV